MHEDKTEKNLREFVNHIAKLRVRVMNDKKDKREKVLREFGNHIEMLKQKYNIEQEDYSKIIALMSEFLFLLQDIEITEELIEMIKKDLEYITEGREMS